MREKEKYLHEHFVVVAVCMYALFSVVNFKHEKEKYLRENSLLVSSLYNKQVYLKW
jgi:hypothetical protein